MLLALCGLATAFSLRVLRTGRFLPATGLEPPGLLFLAAAALATWLAYDRQPAILQFARLLAAAVLFYTVLTSPPPWPAVAACAFLSAAALLALYWPIQHDFLAAPAKFAILQRAGLWLNEHLPRLAFTHLTGPRIHPNVAAGVLAAALPFGAAFTLACRRRGYRPAAAFVFLLSILILLALLLTGSRGAWIGLSSAAVISTLAWLQRRKFAAPRRKLFFWLEILIIALIGLWILVGFGDLENLLGRIPDPTGALVGRPTLWRHGFAVIQDYLFTGSGLMTFPLVFSVYGLLIHVPVHDHLHNTYLQVWADQGFFGFVALLAALLVVARWGWNALDEPPAASLSLTGPEIRWAAFAALLVVAVHGLVDVVFYVTRTLPVIGLLLALAAPAPFTAARLPRIRPRSALLALTLLLPFALFYRPLAAAWSANLGALAQTRLELSVYDPNRFSDPTLDTLRQTLDLTPAEVNFTRSLAIDPTHPVALRRLAALQLSRGQYEPALVSARTALEAGHRDSATRLLLGDALVAALQPGPAADLIAGLPWAEPRLMFQAWYRYWDPSVSTLAPDYPRAAAAWTAAHRLNPANTEAETWRLEASRRAP